MSVFPGFDFSVSVLDTSCFREFPRSVAGLVLNRPRFEGCLPRSGAAKRLLRSDCVGVSRVKFKNGVSRVGSSYEGSFGNVVFADYEVGSWWLDCVPGFCEQVDNWLACECGDEVSLFVFDGLGMEVFEGVKGDALSAVVRACEDTVNDYDFGLQPLDSVYFAGGVCDKVAGFTVGWSGENCVYQAVIAPVSVKLPEYGGRVNRCGGFRKTGVFTEFFTEETDYLFVFFVVRRSFNNGFLRRVLISDSVLDHLISPYMVGGKR